MTTKTYPAPKHPDPIKPPTHKDMLDMIAMASHYAMCDPKEMRMGIGLLSAALYKLGIHQYFSGGWFGGLADVHETTYQSDLSCNKFQWLCLIYRLSRFEINNEES